MGHTYIEYIHEFFIRLTESFGFQIKTELDEEQSFMIEYSSEIYIIKIEKYLREFYVTLYKIDKPDIEINLFNLLEYLKQGEKQIPKSDYFRLEKDINECYRKQLLHLSSVLFENYKLINSTDALKF